MLVAADPAEQSSKLAKAKKWGTPILSIHDFLDRYPPKKQAAEDEQLSLF
jgi:hypothetical protein